MPPDFHKEEYGGYRAIIESLRELVCAQCGETCTTPQARDRVIDLITGGAAHASG